MRLQSIELEQVGTFSAPVRIEGLAAGLNVLAGPNELGKSTILRGLTALFTLKHGANTSDLRDLRPYSGGAPRIACTFDLDGALWRAEKRFLSARHAQLARLDGRQNYHGADADNRLQELLESRPGLAIGLPLLLVRQGASALDLPELDDAMRQSFATLLAGEADLASGLGPSHAVMAAVTAELRDLVGERGKARKNSGYGKALDDRAGVAAALDRAREMAAAATGRLERLAELQTAAAGLSDRAVDDALATAIASAETRLAEAREARHRHDQIGERVTLLDQQWKAHRKSLADHDDGLAQIEKLTLEMDAAERTLSAIVDRLADIAAERRAADARKTDLDTQVDALQQRLDRMRRAGEAAIRRAQLARLRARLERRAVIDRELAEIDAALATMVWPEDALARLRDAASRRDRLEARRDAGLPRLTFTYAEGRHDAFQIDGAVVPDGVEIVADKPLTIDIAGVGRIEVRPGAGAVLDTLAHDLTAARSDLATALAVFGADDIAAAEAVAHRRLAAVQLRARLMAEGEGLAPEGIEPLAGEAARLEHLEAQAVGRQWPHLAVGEAPGEMPGEMDSEAGEANEASKTVESVARRLAEVAADRDAAVLALAALDDARQDHERRRDTMAAERVLRGGHLDELRQRFAPKDATPPRRAALEAAAETAENALNAAVREHLAVRAVVLEDDAMRELEQELQAHRRQLGERARSLAAVHQELRHVEGTLARDFEDGPGDRVAVLEERLAELDARVAAHEVRIAALRLLGDELGAAMARRRDEITGPLTRRLSAMAARIWAGAEVPVGARFAIEGLSRDGRMEAVERVSVGTREQIAVLARLAYAGVLAEKGGSMPLILDDPLVFSDDTRLDRLFDVLADAAQAHQIVILTCHERAFEPLMSRHGAKRIVLDGMALAA